MIRGLVGVIPNHAVEPGRFYLAPGYRDGHWLFQCIQTSEPLDDGFRRKALFLTTGGKPDLGLHDLPSQSPLVALDDVHVRVDPTSLKDSAFTTHLQRGLFLLNGDQPIICAPTDHFRGWAAINLATGRTLEQSLGHGWLSFGRWSLVVDDEAGDELTIAQFGTVEEPAA